MTEQQATRAPHQPNVSWFELFYDLIFVAIVALVGKSFLESPTWGMTGVVFSTLITLFLLWLMATVSHSLVPFNDPIRRALLLVQMILLAVSALAFGSGPIPTWIGLVTTSGALLIISLIYWRNASQQPDLNSILKTMRTSSAVGAVILISSALLTWQVRSFDVAPLSAALLLVGAVVSVVPILSSGLRELVRREALDLIHLEERFALFFIIILGESFVGLLLSVGRIGLVPRPQFFVITFLVAYAVWAIYYNTLIPARMPGTTAGLRIWVLGHALLTISVVAMSVEFTDLTLSGQPGRGLEFEGDWTPLPLLGVSLALALLAYVVQGMTPLIARIQVVSVAILLVLSVVGLLNAPAQTDLDIVAGAAVLIANSVACAVLRVKGDRQGMRGDQA